jgi:trk system potassium uptake protein TrkA
VATVRWTADEMLRRLLPGGAHSLWSDPSGRLLLTEVTYDVSWVGRSIHKVEELVAARVAFLTRFGDAMLVTSSTVLQDGDLLHVLAERGDVARVEQVLSQQPQEQE